MTAIMYCLMVVTKLSVMLVGIFNVVVEDSLLRPTAHYTTSHLENTKKNEKYAVTMSPRSTC